MRPRIYVASSWRNPRFESVVDRLRSEGFLCYDFKRDEGAQFHWSEVGVCSDGETASTYLGALKHPRAMAGFASDFGAMQDCDTCVLVLPCGRSAHLELGWFTGQGRRTAILLDPDPVTPELMYKLVDFVTPSLEQLVLWLARTPVSQVTR